MGAKLYMTNLKHKFYSAKNSFSIRTRFCVWSSICGNKSIASRCNPCPKLLCGEYHSLWRLNWNTWTPATLGVRNLHEKGAWTWSLSWLKNWTKYLVLLRDYLDTNTINYGYTHDSMFHYQGKKRVCMNYMQLCPPVWYWVFDIKSTNGVGNINTQKSLQNIRKQFASRQKGSPSIHTSTFLFPLPLHWDFWGPRMFVRCQQKQLAGQICTS